MSACVITAEIFDAFLKCESKAYFKSLGQIGEPDELVDWQREVKQDFRGVSSSSSPGLTLSTQINLD